MKLFDTIFKDDWKTKWNKTVNFYNRAMFYQNFAKAQIFMPLGLLNETLWILTYLAVLGIKPGKGIVFLAYCLVFLFLMSLGKFLVWLGWMKYIQKLGNEQNSEITEIVQWVRKQQQADVKE